MTAYRFLILAIFALTAGMQASAQDKGPFGGFKHDSSEPIEITADSLEVRQADQVAIYSGSVVAGQGTLRLTANRVEVYIDQENSNSQTGAIQRIEAIGNVFLTNNSETAKGARATYDVASGLVKMSGDVLLTQGGNAISGNELEIDLNSGVGRILGRVKSTFLPQATGGN